MEAGQSSAKFWSTRGHKLDHSFSRMNSRLTFYESARIGIISAYTTGPLWYRNLIKDFLQENNQIQNKTNQNLKDLILYSRKSNFTQNVALYQHELLNKAMSSLVINSTKELDTFALDDVLKKHRFYSVNQ